MEIIWIPIHPAIQFSTVYICFCYKKSGFRFISGSSIGILWSAYLFYFFLVILYGFYYYSSVIQLEVGIVIPPAVSLLFRIVLGMLGFLCSYMKLEIVLSRYLKNHVGIFAWIAFNLYLALVRLLFLLYKFDWFIEPRKILPSFLQLNS